MKKLLTLSYIMVCAWSIAAQTDTLPKILNLDEVVISANKVAESKRTVPQQIRSISAKEISVLNAQNAGDLLSATGLVMVQKSQQGGSSPILRGFEASRVLLVVDGVRMNNLIYRAGHLQNVITVDQNMLERAEVLFGPASTVYGSDALGGVIHFHTKQAQMSTTDKLLFNGSAFARYSSVNNEKTGHLDFNLGGKRLAWLSSVNYSDFGDMRMGTKAQTLDTLWGLRKYYAERINGKDSLVKNDDVYVQKFSGYKQYDILQKLAFKASDKLILGLNVQFSNSSDVPRYDRLTDPKGTGLNSAEWYYGPQKRFLTAFTANWEDKESFFQRIKLNVNYQDIEESRHTRSFGSSNRTSRIENVNVYGANLDFQRATGDHDLRTGIDMQQSAVKSTSILTNVNTNVETPSGASTRYPDGDNTMLNAAAYLTHTWKVTPIFTLTEGVRLGVANLKSTFVSQTFYKFPFTATKQNNSIWSGNIGAILTPTDDFKVSLLGSTGYRVPNVDDLTKIFDTQKGKVVVPNPDLKPERTWNGELGLAKSFGNAFGIEGSFYYTAFKNAIVVDKFQYGGADSIVYDGVKSAVYAPQNKQEANLWGVSLTAKGRITEGLTFAASYNYTKGTVAASAGKSATPLDHVPPAFGRVSLDYNKNNLSASVFSAFSAWKRIADYRLGTEDNEAYATKDGMPSWWTLNARIGYELNLPSAMHNQKLIAQVGVDNIMDIQYRVFASGIHSAGRNVWVSLRYQF
ncbi:MAG: TonB-dependent receptor [Saprospiraceae bacterium]|nr:TonB-dependent receptor [Saprospiraceae bacterium]